MCADVLGDAALKVINPSLLEEVLSQNVLPFVLPFAVLVGKLYDLCGFLKRFGAAEKPTLPITSINPIVTLRNS